MRESIYKYFYVGTITWMSYPGMKQEDVLRSSWLQMIFSMQWKCVNAWTIHPERRAGNFWNSPT